MVKVFSYPVMQVLWNSEGSEEFKGFAHSNDMKEFISNLKDICDRPINEKELSRLKKNLLKIE